MRPVPRVARRRVPEARSQGSIPAGRYGRTSEFAAVVAFACSGRASYLTGEQIRCDGGPVAGY
jgi:3-oxoacyl-[acyl-carrier protein] reductase